MKIPKKICVEIEVEPKKKSHYGSYSKEKSLKEREELSKVFSAEDFKL